MREKLKVQYKKLTSGFSQEIESKDISKIRIYILLTVLFSVTLFYLGVFTRHTTDYATHTVSMEHLPLRPLLNPTEWGDYFSEHAYPLWHILGHFLMRFLACPADYAAGIATGILLIVSYIGVIYLLNNATKNLKVNNVVVPVLAFMLFIFGPVWRPWENEYIILGNGGPNVWHNATNICGRAIGIFAFAFSFKMLNKIIESKYQYIPSVVYLIVLSFIYWVSIIAKPSFAQVFVPAFGILLVVVMFQSKGKFKKQFCFFVGSAVLPLSYLMFQYFHYFGTTEDNKGMYTERIGEGTVLNTNVSLAEVYNVMKINFWVLLFPICLFIIMACLKRLDKYHLITLLMFLFGCLYVVMLKGAASGEMGWAYYMAVFFVFLVAVRDYIFLFFSEEGIMKKRMGSVLFGISSILLCEHFAVGVYYLYQLIGCKALRF